jgi:hypothetical protein
VASGPVEAVGLNGDILRALGWSSDAVDVYDPSGERRSGIPSYTLSLDAAMTLIPTGWWWSIGDCSVSADASCGPDVAHCSKDMLVRFDDGIHVDIDQPSTPALALCSVALRARAATMGGSDEQQL